MNSLNKQSKTVWEKQHVLISQIWFNLTEITQWNTIREFKSCSEQSETVIKVRCVGRKCLNPRARMFVCYSHSTDWSPQIPQEIYPPSSIMGDTQLQNNSLVIICVSYSVVVQEVFVKHGHLFAVQGPPSSWKTGETQGRTLQPSPLCF